MSRRMPGTISLVGVALLLACSHPLVGSHSSGELDSEPDSARDTPSHAIVFTGSQLWKRNTDLLTALNGHVAGMQVAETIGCPAITLRGSSSLTNLSDPRIYVNGEPAANTCILQSLNTADLQRVEIYPSGISSRPGYFNDANGLILIFLKSANQP